MEPPDFGHRNDLGRNQLYYDDPQDARTRHDPMEDAAVYLGLVVQHADGRRHFPPIDRYTVLDVFRPLPRHALFYDRARRQRHDVHQPYLDVGTPRSVCIGAASVWRIL